MNQKDPGPLPARWLNCPRKAAGLVADKFLAFKTPLGHQFNDKVPEANRFTPSMLLDYMKGLKVKLGLWIDLTNTSRFYDKREIEDIGCKYVKLSCRGHGETPTVEQTKEFILLVSKFLSKKPLEVIGVHCTHGFNRTGFLLVSYMVEQLDCSLEAAIKEFSRVRPPGIYKQDYLEELYRRYEMDEVPIAPIRPDWCNEEEEIDYDDDTPSNSNSDNRQKKGKRRRDTKGKNKTFIPEVRGVELFDVQPRASELQKKVQKFCKWKTNDFPGSQPVSMNMENVNMLRSKPYRVSWKADGVRYMMLIDGKDEVYMFDRDNCVFKVHGMQFLHRKDHHMHLKDTLLDGEMVVDKHKDGREVPRYLCYDVITFDGHNVGKEPFFPNRLSCIENEIVNPRHAAMKQAIIRKENEPFSIMLKQFWDISMSRKLLGEKFAKSLLHEPDGLIFQPALEPYVPGPCQNVLKWKPETMNSIDFKLKIVVDSGLGIVPKKVGHLYVGKMDRAFDTITVTKELKNLDNKIIECRHDGTQWVFMRERTDKSYPNSYNTAHSVLWSILYPITKDILLNIIENKDQCLDDASNPPPMKRICRP